MRSLSTLLLIGLLWPVRASAQGPSLDPNFAIGQVYAPGALSQAVQQADGKLILLGDFERVSGTTVMHSGYNALARLLPGTGQLDAGFAANVAGLRGELMQVLPLPNGKLLLLGGQAPLQLGSVVRQHLLLLNADGTPDTGFNAGSGLTLTGPPRPNLGITMVAQPDGKILLTGFFSAINGQPVGNLARLNQDGSLDNTFQAAGALNGVGQFLVLQPDGKLLVTGGFTTVHGQAQARLARLLPNGTLDTSFAPVVPAAVGISRMAVQPGGAVVVAAARSLMRLLPTGAIDPGFQTGTGLVPLPGTGLELGQLAVQADGKIVLGVYAATYDGTPIGRIIRLLPDGPLDASFANRAALVDGTHAPLTLQILPNGQLLTALGTAGHFGGLNSLPTSLALLAANGARDPAFTATVQRPGTVFDVARQPNSKLIVGGDFTEINGLAAGFLARLEADGTPEVAFTTAAAANAPVRSVAVQPDGKILVGGSFTFVGGINQSALARLQSSGAVDGTFLPTIFASGTLDAEIQQLVLQPDNNVLLRGQFNLRGPAAAPQDIARVLGSSGQRDGSFRPADSTGVTTLLAQPDGRIVVGGAAEFNGVMAAVWRMLPSGALDPSFALTATSNPSGLAVVGTALARDPTGRLYVARFFGALGSASTYDVARFSAAGQPDASFQASFSRRVYEIACLTVQPNGRILAGGSFQGIVGYEGSARLLANGALDNSYNSTGAFGDGVSQLLVQPDGAIIGAGAFNNVSGLPVLGLARLLDANVLAVHSPQLIVGLDVWPVPTHGTLYLRLTAWPAPYQVELFDMLGRLVFTQQIAHQDASCDVSRLPTGVYRVRVKCGDGVVGRQIVIE